MSPGSEQKRGATPPSIIPFEGKTPQFDASVFIDPNARLIGDILLGPKVSIWPSVLLRADSDRIIVGGGSVLFDKVFVEAPKGYPVVIEENALISHGAILHGCIVREGAIVGIGAIVLDGAEIGQNAIVGSGCVVPPGMKVPEASLALGIPAKVVRSLTGEDLRRSKEQLDEAYEKSRKYLELYGRNE